MKRSWSILSALLPKIGMNPEDLTPLIQEAKKIKEQAERDMTKPEEEKE